MYFTVFIYAGEKDKWGLHERAENSLRMVVLSALQLIYNLRNLNLKYVNFEPKSSKIGKKMVAFSKNSFDDPRGDMDLKPFRGARYGSYLLALAAWASWVKCRAVITPPLWGGGVDLVGGSFSLTFRLRFRGG